VRGSCLCGAVVFELSGVVPDLYQCHCSLCRKVTGSSANAAIRIAAQQFRWIRGSEQISRYATDSGYRSHFCRACGSPLPNPRGDGSGYWVPAGLLDDTADLNLAAHLYVGSRATWDVIADTGQHFDEMPNAAALDEILRHGKPGA